MQGERRRRYRAQASLRRAGAAERAQAPPGNCGGYRLRYMRRDGPHEFSNMRDTASPHAMGFLERAKDPPFELRRMHKAWTQGEAKSPLSHLLPTDRFARPRKCCGSSGVSMGVERWGGDKFWWDV
ncbi:hypothetical protein VW29_19270, partial [Devosia limi DSM 17137]